MATLSSLGFVTSLGLALFLACKLCTEVLEASQTTSFVLLAAISLAYLSFIPYGLEATEVICPLRLTMTRAAFAFMFSVMLSRSIMLATADADGLPGHISGGIQMALFIFMASVEVAILVQEWLASIPGSTFNTRRIIVNGKYEKLVCSGLELGQEFLTDFSYLMLLLGLQLLLTPLIIRSKRNYREGLLYSCGAFTCLLVWIGWTVAFFHFQDVFWREISIVSGLVATPTLLILVVFVPKCYLVTSSRPTTSSSYKHNDVSLHGLASHTSISRSASSRLSHLDDVVGNGSAEGTVTNSLAAIGSTRSLYNTASMGAASSRGQQLQQHPSIATRSSQGAHKEYRSSLYGMMGTSKSQRTSGLPHFLAAGLPCDSPEHRAMASEYPTYKLDQNTVADTSISWERYGNNGHSTGSHSSRPFPS